MDCNCYCVYPANATRFAYNDILHTSTAKIEIPVKKIENCSGKQDDVQIWDVVFTIAIL